MLATARMLHAAQLIGENLDWGAEFNELGTDRSGQLICALSFLTREPHGWAGWTDADFTVDRTRYRLFVPIWPEPEIAIRVDALPPEEVQRLIVPQLLSSDSRGKPSILTIQRLIFEPWDTMARYLFRRDEVYVDLETYSSHYNARAYVIRIAADRIASRLERIPLPELQRRIWELTGASDPLAFNVAERVREILGRD